MILWFSKIKGARLFFEPGQQLKGEKEGVCVLLWACLVQVESKETSMPVIPSPRRPRARRIQLLYDDAMVNHPKAGLQLQPPTTPGPGMLTSRHENKSMFLPSAKGRVCNQSLTEVLLSSIMAFSDNQ